MQEPVEDPLGLRIVEEHEFARNIGAVMQIDQQLGLAPGKIIQALEDFLQQLRFDNLREFQRFCPETLFSSTSLVVFEHLLQFFRRQAIEAERECFGKVESPVGYAIGKILSEPFFIPMGENILQVADPTADPGLFRQAVNEAHQVDEGTYFLRLT